MFNIRDLLENHFLNIFTFFKWLILSIIIGSLVGLIGIIFHHMIEASTTLCLTYRWLLFLLPLGGLLIVFFYRTTHMSDDTGTNLVLLSIRSEENLRLRTAPLIFISTVITHLFGGSSGREGAALQLGGSIAAWLGKCFKVDEKDLRIMIMAGMSAAFSAVFGTPLVAAIFPLEVVSVGVMYYVALVPCIVSSLVAHGIATLLGGHSTYFTLLEIPTLTPLTGIQTTILAMLLAGLSIIFCKILHVTGNLYRKFLRNTYLRIISGGFLVIGLTFICGTRDYLGAGMPIIKSAITGHVVWYAFLLKMLFTAITLGCGYKGGEIVPTFFVGATFGHTISKLIGLNPSFGAGIGLIGLFCAVTNCPISAFILSIELFGGEGMLFFMLTSAISYMLSGYYSLYNKQKIMYSKSKPEFINTLTH